MPQFASADTLAIVAAFALTAAVLLFIFATEPDPVDFAPHRSRLDQLIERRDAIYDNLRDLKFEYRAGKFAEQDYEHMKLELEKEAALVLAEIETTTGNEMRLARADAVALGDARVRGNDAAREPAGTGAPGSAATSSAPRSPVLPGRG